VPAFEAVTLAALLARTTSRSAWWPRTWPVRLPLHTARRLASLDHLSGGALAGGRWTSPDDGDEAVYGLAVGGRMSSRSRAAEFVEVVLALWDTWEPGAELPDRAAGNFRANTQIHPIDHRPPTNRVHGPLDVPRCRRAAGHPCGRCGHPTSSPWPPGFADAWSHGVANEADWPRRSQRTRRGRRAGPFSDGAARLPALGWPSGTRGSSSIGERDLSQRLGEVVTSTGADGATLVGRNAGVGGGAGRRRTAGTCVVCSARPRSGRDAGRDSAAQVTETDRSVA